MVCTQFKCSIIVYGFLHNKNIIWWMVIDLIQAEFIAWKLTCAGQFAKTWQDDCIFARCLFNGRGWWISMRVTHLILECNNFSFVLQRTLDARGQHKKGAIAIIVCLTASVPKIADLCRKLLQIPKFKTKVVEAIGARDTMSVMVNFKIQTNSYAYYKFRQWLLV